MLSGLTSYRNALSYAINCTTHTFIITSITSMRTTVFGVIITDEASWMSAKIIYAYLNVMRAACTLRATHDKASLVKLFNMKARMHGAILKDILMPPDLTEAR